jgi:hypothetical protein
MSANSGPRGCRVSNLSPETLTHCSYGPGLGHVKLVRIHPCPKFLRCQESGLWPQEYKDIWDIGF